MSETPTALPVPEEGFYSCEVLIDGKKYELFLNAKDNILEINFSEKSTNKLIQTSYRNLYKFDSLLNIDKFFAQYDDIIDVFYAVKDIITKNSYRLEKNEKEISFVIVAFGKEVILKFYEKFKIVDEMIITIANDLFKLKEKFLKKLKEIEEVNQSFSEIKKQNKQLIQQNKQLNEKNKKIIKENKELQKTIKTLKETRIEILNTKIETILNNALMTDADKNALRNYERLTGDLVNENTIAFDNLCKAYLCYWLLNKNKNDINKRIKTVLLYKGTRDGDKAETFHEKCNNKGATLTLVKSTTNFHFGGFTTTQWIGSGSYKSDSESFLFSLDKKLKYSLKDSSNAVYDDSSYGPTFGGGHDIYIADGCMNNENSYSNAPYSYDVADSFSGSYSFKVSEIEVYQIIFQ